MRRVWVLYKREIKAQMSASMIYILAAIFIGLLGYLFFNVFAMANQVQNLTVESPVMQPIFGNINTLFIFIIPLLAAKLFTEEKKQGTMDLLFLSPLSDSQIVLAKVLVGMTIILFFLSLTSIFPIILVISGYQGKMILLTSYGGSFLHAVCCLILCCFISSLTKNFVLSAMLGIFSILFLISLSWTAQTSKNFLISQIFEYMSLAAHYEPFSRGTVRSYDLVYYLSFFAFFWFLTIRSLHSRNW